MLLKPWLAPLVILFWLVTTGWLVVEKILPFLMPGSPPGYEAIALSEGRTVPVAWTVMWNEEPVGWAFSRAVFDREGMARVRTGLHLDRIPIADVLPKWSKTFLRNLPPAAKVLSIEADGSLLIGKGGELRSFQSDIRLPSVGQSVSLDGSVDGETVSASLRSGELRYDVTRTIPSAIRLGDELSPMATMPGLHVGKRWTVPIYSPLKLGGSPIELLHARVGAEETMFWEDQLVRTLVVAYRDDPSPRREPKFRIWVDRSGKVLKQDSNVMGVQLVFVRRADDAAESLIRSIDAEASVGTGMSPFEAGGPPDDIMPQPSAEAREPRRRSSRAFFESSWGAWLADKLPAEMFAQPLRMTNGSSPDTASSEDETVTAEEDEP